MSTWRKQLSLAESSEAPHGLAVAWMTWSLEHRGGERHAAGWGWELGLGLRGFLNEKSCGGVVSCPDSCSRSLVHRKEGRKEKEWAIGWLPPQEAGSPL